MGLNLQSSTQDAGLNPLHGDARFSSRGSPDCVPRLVVDVNVGSPSLMVLPPHFNSMTVAAKVLPAPLLDGSATLSSPILPSLQAPSRARLCITSRATAAQSMRRLWCLGKEEQHGGQLGPLHHVCGLQACIHRPLAIPRSCQRLRRRWMRWTCPPCPARPQSWLMQSRLPQSLEGRGRGHAVTVPHPKAAIRTHRRTVCARARSRKWASWRTKDSSLVVLRPKTRTSQLLPARHGSGQ